MKCKYLIVIISMLFICLGGQVLARYILNKNLDVNIKSAPFYFEAEIENTELELNNNQAELNLTIKNNDGINYNLYYTNYKISLESDKLKLKNEDIEIGTIAGNSLIDENIEIILEKQDNVAINFIENIELKITTTYPYKKEIKLPLSVFEIGKVWEFDYIDDIQKFIVPTDGCYKLEVWGAQGGSTEGYTTAGVLANARGGYGAYSIGNIDLNKNQELFIVVGGQGESGMPTQTRHGGYNGGGTTYPWENDPNNNHTNRFVAGGGGATHIAFTSGVLTTLKENKDDVIIVSGGGGGGYLHTNANLDGTPSGYGNGGDAGGFQGNNGSASGNGSFYGLGGTQEAAGYAFEFNSYGMGDFGLGGDVTYYAHGSAGGGGWYGGGASLGGNGQEISIGNSNSSGGGGSGYISYSNLKNKYMVGYNCLTSDNLNTKTISTSNVSEEAISDYAKIGNGYAKITFLSK